eukprot:403354168
MLNVVKFVLLGKNEKQQGSFTTIFSVWNSMVGTGLLTIPWAYSNSGFILGIIITFLQFVVSFYTCYLVLKVAGDDTDYTDTLKKYFGKQFRIKFFINLQERLDHRHDRGSDRKIDTGIDFGEFSYSYTCIIILVVLLLITSIRNLSIFVKIATIGVIFVFLIIVFIMGVGIYGFTNTHYVYTAEAHVDDPESSQILFFNGAFGPLMGILGGGYYLHNISIPIVRNAKNPENNVRDVFIGYFLVFISYFICGLFGYYGFTGTYFTQTLHEPEILSNCLLMFDSKNIIAIIIRFCVFCQLLASMSLIFAVQRQQIFLVSFGSNEQRSQKTTWIANTLMLVPTFILAVFYPQVGKLAGYLGSIGGLGCIYVLPTVTHLKSNYLEIYNPLLSEAIKNNKYQLTQNSTTMSPQISVDDQFLRSKLNKSQNNQSTEQQRKKRFVIDCIIGVIIIILGLFGVIAQYI